jgi:hypothetical protein
MFRVNFGNAIRQHLCFLFVRKLIVMVFSIARHILN